MKSIPFSIFVLAPFPGVPVQPGDKPYIGPFDLNDIDDGIAALNSRIDIVVSQNVCTKGQITVEISKIADLSPSNLVSRSPYLKSLADALEYARDHQSDPVTLAEGLMAKFGNLPLDLTVLTPQVTEPSEQTSVLDALFDKIELPEEQNLNRPREVHQQIEEKLKTALTCVYDDSDFQKLESILRGIQLLVEQGPIDKSDNISVTLCPVNWNQLEDVLRQIVRNSGKQTPSLLLVDLPFDNSYSSVDALETLVNFSEAVNAPTVASLDPSFFGIKSWDALPTIGYLGHEVQSGRFAKFRKLQASPRSSWVTLSLPGLSIDVQHQEKKSEPLPVQFSRRGGTITSSIWAVGAMAAQSQKAVGWPSRLTDSRVSHIPDTAAKVNVDGQSTRGSSLPSDRIEQFWEVGTTPLGQEQGILLRRAPTISGTSLGNQLFTSRVLHFFFELRQKALQSQNFDTPDDLAHYLKETFLGHCRETGQPEPYDVTIGTATDNGTGQVTLSVRMTPPRALAPESTLLEFELQFNI